MRRRFLDDFDGKPLPFIVPSIETQPQKNQMPPTLSAKKTGRGYKNIIDDKDFIV
jgi:hypothetical protein